MNITSAIIYTNRLDIRDAVRQELKANGIQSSNIHNVRTLDEYKIAQNETGRSFQILDWEVNPEDILTILEECRKKYKMETDPIFLVTATLGNDIMAVAREFHITHVHAGELSRDIIQKEIRIMVGEIKKMEPIKQVFCRIEACYSQGKVDEAGTILEQIFRKTKDNPRVIADLAENYIQRDKWDEAYELLSQMETVAKTDARIKHLLAKCYLKQKLPTKAVDSLKDAQLINPRNVERLLELGHILLQDQPIEAKEKFNEILDFAPQSKRGKMGKGSAMLLSGEVNEALKMLKDAVNSRELASIFNTSAILSIKTKKFESGLALYETACQTVEKNHRVLAKLLYNMGIGYVKWSKKEKGLECFQKSLELDPSYADANYNINAINKSLKQQSSLQEEKSTLESLSHFEESKLSFNSDFEDDFD